MHGSHLSVGRMQHRALQQYPHVVAAEVEGLAWSLFTQSDHAACSEC